MYIANMDPSTDKGIQSTDKGIQSTDKGIQSTDKGMTDKCKDTRHMYVHQICTHKMRITTEREHTRARAHDKEHTGKYFTH